MEISFTLDWASFIAGFVSAVVVSFIGLVIIAGVQYSKQRKASGLTRRSRI